MRTISILISMVALSAMLTITANANETFGLGQPVEAPITHAVAETFGLDGITKHSPGARSRQEAGVVVRHSQQPLAMDRPIFVQQTKQPVTPVQSLIPVVRRATRNWVDASVGAWSQTKLSAHLRGELASSQHRGAVPLQQLPGRTLTELLAIHDNLHEGWLWDGSARVLSSVTVRQSTTVRQYRPASSCPGGVCPTPTRGRLFRR